MDRIDMPRLMLSILIVACVGGFIAFFPKLFLIVLASAAAGLFIAGWVALVYCLITRDDDDD